MTKKNKLQFLIGALCVVGAMATLFGGVNYGLLGLGCFIVAGILLIPLLRMGN